MSKTNVFGFLRNKDNSAVTLQNIEEIDITDTFNDDVDSKLDSSALLSVYAFDTSLVGDMLDIKVMLRGNLDVTLKAWQVKQRCYQVLKVYDTGTTVEVEYLKLNR